MPNKSNKKIDYKATIKIYFEATKADMFKSSAFSEGKAQNCPDVLSVAESNIQKYSRAWQSLSKK